MQQLLLLFRIVSSILLHSLRVRNSNERTGIGPCTVAGTDFAQRAAGALDALFLVADDFRDGAGNDCCYEQKNNDIPEHSGFPPLRLQIIFRLSYESGIQCLRS